MKKLLILIAFFSLSLSNKIALSDNHVEKVWETEKIFELPESVIYDPTNDVLYVSNITDHPFNKDGTGYISKIGLDGTIIEKKWIDPKILKSKVSVKTEMHKRNLFREFSLSMPITEL